MNVELVQPILGFGKGCDSLDRRALAKEITSIEEGLLKPEIGKGLIIAITGAPGVGKSCLIDALLHCWTPELKVAVLAVDPSSPISGGALLGDRIRMTALDDSERRDRIYLRSIATRSASGSTPYVVSDLCSHLLARDFDLVIIETVGAGQAEVRCAAMAEKIIVIEGPGRGDGVQAEKAGILELADLVVVNKCDLPGADVVVNQLSISLDLDIEPPTISKVSALKGDGIEKLAKTILNIKQRTTSEKARIRERIMIANERRFIESIDFEAAIDLIHNGQSTIDEIMESSK